MPVLKVWYSTVVTLAACGMSIVISGTSTPIDSQDLIFGLIGQQWSSQAAKVGVEDALNDINNNSDLLSDYKLKFIQHTTGSLETNHESQNLCSREAALTELFGQIFNSSRQIVALIGLGCPVSTEASAEVSHYYNIIQLSGPISQQLSCASSSYELSNGTKFPYYFQLLPSEVNLARVFYSIIKEYDWRRVALIVQNEQQYRATMRDLKVLLTNLSVSYIEMILDTAKEKIDDQSLFDPQTRIFVIASDSKHARWIICMAHNQEKKYPRYVFLTYGNYEPQWWMIRDDSGGDNLASCSPEERAEVLQFSLAAVHFHSPSKNASLDPKLATFQQHFVDQQKSSHSMELEFYYQCYDATLALALALNKTIEALNFNETLRGIATEQGGLPREGNFYITDFNYGVSVVAKLIKKFLDNTNFIGVSGPVHFDQNGIRNVTGLRVFQYRTTYVNGTPINDAVDDTISSSASMDQRLRLIEVAHVGEDRASLEFLDNNIWPNHVPHDGLPDPEIATIFVPITVIFVLLDVCGLIFAIACLVFNVRYRDKKLIRLTSPNLNYLMIIGTLLMYCSGIAFVIPTKYPSAVLCFCFIRMWSLIFGYTCGFGTIVAKLWRVYYIFRNPQVTKRKRGIQDWHLALFVLSLLVLNVSILFLHIFLEGIIAKFEVREVSSREKPSAEQGDLGVLMEFFIYQCSSHPWIRYSILATVYGCLVFLHVCALYFAFQTRKVKVKVLNDAKYIAAIVYITTIVLSITLVTSFALSSYINIYASINSTGIWATATVILALIFIPKMVKLYKDPDGERVFTAHEEAMQITTAVGGPQALPQRVENECDTLKRKVQQMEDIIKEYKRMTGLDITKRFLTPSAASCTTLSTKQNGASAHQESMDKAKHLIQSSTKVSFSELSHPPPVQADERKN